MVCTLEESKGGSQAKKEEHKYGYRNIQINDILK
jgi:hypothetical protein